MKKNNMVLFLVSFIILTFGGVMLFKSQINNKNKVNKPVQQETNTANTSSTLPLNNNSYPIHMIEGTIDKIYGTTPFKMDVNIRISKILANQKEIDAIKTITAKDDTDFVLSELDSKKESAIKPSSLKVKDEIVIWIAESNSDLLKLNQFTATKIVKYQAPNSITPTKTPFISNTPDITNTTNTVTE